MSCLAGCKEASGCPRVSRIEQPWTSDGATALRLHTQEVRGFESCRAHQSTVWLYANNGLYPHNNWGPVRDFVEMGVPTLVSTELQNTELAFKIRRRPWASKGTTE